MSFKEKKYTLIKEVISKELSNFVYDYFLLKRKVDQKLLKDEIISKYTPCFGNWNDAQVPNTYSIYADVVMETLLQRVKPIMEKHTGLKLLETYSYARLYKKGDVLARHKDRISCEISTTLNLGGDEWPFYLDPTGKTITDPSTVAIEAGIKIILKPGDMLIYAGCDLEHWREEFKGENCGQLFLHYNIDNEFNRANIYDGRPFVGLPSLYNTRKKTR
tara:strand:- start:1426 stop:2079 length:654 start_codon:yes stop_codon:yes gene_type:complete